MAQPKHPAAIVLAGGLSSRMKQPKMSLAYSGGTFLSHLVQAYRRVGCRCVIVVVSEYPSVLGKDQSILEWVRNPRPEDGPLSSLKLALEKLAPYCPGFFIHPVDHPAVSDKTLLGLLQAWGGNPYRTVKPVFNGRGGHPLLMGRGWTHLIHRLPLTATLRDLLHAHQDNVMALPVLDSGILLNINSPADYRRLLKLYPDADASAT